MVFNQNISQLQKKGCKLSDTKYMEYCLQTIIESQFAISEFENTPALRELSDAEWAEFQKIKVEAVWERHIQETQQQVQDILHSGFLRRAGEKPEETIIVPLVASRNSRSVARGIELHVLDLK